MTMMCVLSSQYRNISSQNSQTNKMLKYGHCPHNANVFQGDSTCKSIDGCCLSSILSCLSTFMFPYVPAFQALPRTKVKVTLKRGLDFMLFGPDTDIDSLDIVLVSVTFGFTFLD